MIQGDRTFMKEKDVVHHIRKHYEDQDFLVQEQFEIESGKVDIAAFKWINDYKIASLAVECKATYNPKAIMKILMTQISSYQRCFPRVFLGIPEGGDINTLKKLCETCKAGYIVVTRNKKVRFEKDAPELTPAFNDESYISEVFHRAAMSLAFREVFGNQLLSTSRWVSTKGDVGFSVSYESSIVNFNINLEDIRKIFSRFKKEELNEVLIKAPSDSWLWIAKERYFGKGFRVRSTLISKYISDFCLRDAEHLLKLTREESTNIHLAISKPIWTNWEILNRQSYVKKIQQAKNEFAALHSHLCHYNNKRK